MSTDTSDVGADPAVEEWRAAMAAHPSAGGPCSTSCPRCTENGDRP